MKRLKQVALLMGTTLLCLVSVELWLRTRSEAELGFGYELGRFVKAREFEVDGVSNELGFHDLRHGPKRPGTFRIVLLGDSYVAARSVPVAQTVGQRLEHHLTREGVLGAEVVSFGRPGWGQRQQIKLLHERGEELEPDLVLTLFLTLNDVKDNYGPLRAKRRRQRKRIAAERPGWATLRGEDAPFFWLEDSYLNRLVSYRLALAGARRRTLEVPIDYMVHAAEYDEAWQAAWQQTEDLLAAMKAISVGLGARYALVSASTPQGVLGEEAWRGILYESYPAMRRGSWQLDKPDRLLAGIAGAHEIPFLALEPGFRTLTLEEGRVLHWKIDGHWNVEGNDVAGRAIASFLMERGLVPMR